MAYQIKNLLGTRGGPSRKNTNKTLKRAFVRMVIGSVRIPRGKTRTITEGDYNQCKDLIESLESMGAISVDRSAVKAAPAPESKKPAPKPAPKKVEPAPAPVKKEVEKAPEPAPEPAKPEPVKVAPVKVEPKPAPKAEPAQEKAPKRTAKKTPSPRAAARKKAAEAKASKENQ